jgi:hypothetical protein
MLSTITKKKLQNQQLQKEKKLANQYCQSCHMLPDPKWVDAKTWENGVLPAMGPRLGLFSSKGKHYPAQKYNLSLPQDFYPSSPVLTEEQWQRIIDYYVSMASEKNDTKQVRSHPIENTLSLFTALSPERMQGSPSTSFVKIDKGSQNFPFIVSDAVRHKIFRYDQNLVPKDSITTWGPTVNIEITAEGMAIMRYWNFQIQITIA